LAAEGTLIRAPLMPGVAEEPPASSKDVCSVVEVADAAGPFLQSRPLAAHSLYQGLTGDFLSNCHPSEVTMIRLKSAYEKPSPEDGFCVLVDRFWPWDLDEKNTNLGLWLREVAPSIKLHEAFGENPEGIHTEKALAGSGLRSKT